MDAQKHDTTPRKKSREAFQWGAGGWGAEACTPPGLMLKYFWGLCSMSRIICMIIVDLIACSLAQLFHKCCGI
jgi:hypothetical protein